MRYFKVLVKAAILSHYQLEQQSGHEISPATQLTDNEETQRERDFCENLYIGKLSPGLSW
jgi:hypothetical protein